MFLVTEFRFFCRLYSLFRLIHEPIPPSAIPMKSAANNKINSGISIIIKEGFSEVNGFKERLTGDRLAIANMTTKIKTGIRMR